MVDDHSHNSHSWFWKLLINSKVISFLCIILLVLLIIFVYTKIAFVFNPVWQIIGLLLLPMIISGIFFYMLNPLVNILTKKFKCQRLLVITIIFIILAILLCWAIFSIIPMISYEWNELLTNWPSYLDKIDRVIKSLSTKPEINSISKRLSIFKIKNHSGTDYVNQILLTTTNSFNNMLSKLAYIVISLITSPLILFYLLKDSGHFSDYVAHFLPTKTRPEFKKIMHQVNTQMSNYIRGKVLVALGAFVVYLIGYSLIGLNYALLVGAVAGLLTFVPYVGSVIALIPVLIISYFTSIGMVIKVLIVYFVEQFIEGRILTPTVIGNSMKIYPITILVIIVVGGKLWGLAGVILAVPVYAAIKVIVQEIFYWYQQKSGLYK